MKTDGEIREAVDALYEISGDKKARMLAEMREKAIMDEQSRLSGARKEGIKQGIEVGRRQEREQAEKEKLLVADKLLSLGLDLNVVAETLGLSGDVLKKLSKQ